MRALASVKTLARILNSPKIPIEIPASCITAGNIPATIRTPARITTSIKVSPGVKIV